MHVKGPDRGKGLSKQRGSVWIGRSGGSSAIVIPLGNVSGGNGALEIITR